MDKRNKNHTFPIVTAALSILTLINIVLNPLDIFGIASISLGVIGIILYYRDNTKYDYFFYAWIFMQLPNIFLRSEAEIVTPIMNAFPTSLIPFNMGIGLNLELKGRNELIIYLNLIPIGLYFLLKYLNVDKPLGTNISISRLRKGTFPQIQFPIIGTIEKIVGRRKFDAVYFIKLEKEIIIKDKSYSSILLEPKDLSLIQLNRKRQICGLRIVEQDEVIFSEAQNPFLDWVSVEVI